MKTNVLLSLVFFFCIVGLYAQKSDYTKTISQNLGKVEYLQKDGRNIFLFENQNYRFHPKAISRVLDTLSKANLPDYELIVHLQGLPFSALKLERQGEKYQVSNFAISKQKESFYKNKFKYQLLEFYMDPQLKFGLGGFPDPVKIQVKLVPGVKLSLWPGMAINAQLIIPVLNELDVPLEDKIRPGFLTIQQILRLPEKTYLDISAGYFSNQRYGINAGFYKYTLRDRLLLYGKVGYTGFASNPKFVGLTGPEPGWQISDINYFDFEVGSRYRWEKYDVILGGAFQKFLFQRQGIKMSITRQFNEVDLGFIAIIDTKEDRQNYGFQIRIPLWPGRYLKKGNLILRPARYFDLTYFGTLFPFSEYSTGNSFLELTDNVHPSFLKNQVIR